MTTAQTFKVTYDTGFYETVTLDQILRWRKWSAYTLERLERLAAGQLRLLSTDRGGVPCDIELVRAA